MTDLLLPEDTVLHESQYHTPTYRLRPPALRRPSATGEQPVYRPATIADLDAPVDELTRLALGETLVLPVDACPVPVREAVPTVYAAPVGDRPPGYRGTRRMPMPPAPRWAWGCVGAGLVLAAQSAVGLVLLAVAW